jgi:heme oxygenase
MLQSLKRLFSNYFKDKDLISSLIRDVYDLFKHERIEYKNDLQRFNTELRELYRERDFYRDLNDAHLLERCKWLESGLRTIGDPISEKCLEEVEKEFGHLPNDVGGNGFEN